MAKTKKQELESSEGVAVRFTVSPVGPYGLGYFSGDVAVIDPLLAGVIVENGHAEYCEPVETTETTDETTVATEETE